MNNFTKLAVAALLGLTLVSTTAIADVKKGQKGYYVFQFRERKEPPVGDFEKERESIKKKLLQQKKNKVVEEWLEQVKSQNEIIIESDFLE